MKSTLAGRKKNVSKVEKVELKALLPQNFMYVDKHVSLPGFNIVAHTTIKTDSGLRVALQVTSSTTCICGGESYFDVTDMMSELISVGFNPVPVGISSDLPLRELPSNTVVFLRSHHDPGGLGNYLLCSDSQDHRPIPVRQYSKIRILTTEELTIIVDHDIPSGIFESETQKAAVA